jgi:hypothetical protein
MIETNLVDLRRNRREETLLHLANIALNIGSASGDFQTENDLFYRITITFKRIDPSQPVQEVTPPPTEENVNKPRKKSTFMHPCCGSRSGAFHKAGCEEDNRRGAKKVQYNVKTSQDPALKKPPRVVDTSEETVDIMAEPEEPDTHECDDCPRTFPGDAEKDDYGIITCPGCGGQNVFEIKRKA